MKRYNVINADNETIRTVVASTQKAASKKVKFLFGRASCFLKIEFKEEV